MKICIERDAQKSELKENFQVSVFFKLIYT